MFSISSRHMRGQPRRAASGHFLLGQKQTACGRVVVFEFARVQYLSLYFLKFIVRPVYERLCQHQRTEVRFLIIVDFVRLCRFCML